MSPMSNDGRGDNESMEKKIRVGVDIGRVIIGGSGGDGVGLFKGDYRKTPEIPDAIKSVAKLNEKYEVWLLSKCKVETQEKILLWLAGQNFHERTGVPLDRILFCLQRPEKAPIAQAHDFKVFIDDREDIIESMNDILPHPILFTSWENTNRIMDNLLASGFLKTA